MKIAILEDSEIRIECFKDKFPEAFISANPDEFLNKISEEKFDVLFLDHDLGFYVFEPYKREITGYDVAKNIPESFDGFVIIHSNNTVGSMNMENILKQKNVNCIRAMFPNCFKFIKG